MLPVAQTRGLCVLTWPGLSPTGEWAPESMGVVFLGPGENKWSSHAKNTDHSSTGLWNAKIVARYTLTDEIARPCGFRCSKYSIMVCSDDQMGKRPYWEDQMEKRFYLARHAALVESFLLPSRTWWACSEQASSSGFNHGASKLSGGRCWGLGGAFHCGSVISGLGE